MDDTGGWTMEWTDDGWIMDDNDGGWMVDGGMVTTPETMTDG